MEKTFKEMIEEIALCPYTDEVTINVNVLLQAFEEVREATIAECLEIADKLYWNQDGKYLSQIESLPTDRILITENEE